MVRSILRNIAKNRMKDMGIGNINQKMGVRFGDKETMPGREMICKLNKTHKGREVLAKAYKEHPALWTEVLSGSKAKDAYSAFRRKSTERLLQRHPDNPTWPKKKDPQKLQTR